MIVMIDHLAFASDRADDDLAVFRELGYQAEFVEKDLRDLDNKRPFMAQFSGRLDMALLKRPGSLSIELLDHGHVVTEGSYLYPVLDGVTDDLEKLDESFVLPDRSFFKVRSGTLRAEFFVQESPAASEVSCTTVIADANDIGRSAAFWKGLGFKPVTEGDGVIQLQFRSLVGGETFEMILREKLDTSKRRLLDDRGFNCIAFFSSSAERDRQKFERLGMRPSDINAFRVGGKDLAIFWLRGPGDEVVEVIGLA